MRVLLVPNVNNRSAVAAACDLSSWLSVRDIEPVLVTGDAVACGLESLAIGPSEVGEPALVVAFGGDGTILKAVGLLGEVETPVLGVNFGRLGFLSGAEGDDVREAVASALAGEAHMERRSTLAVDLVMGGKVLGRHRALNEVVLGRGEANRVVRISVSVNGCAMDTYSCDGVIVATPTGSTAYAMSAGGPIVAPSVGGMLVVPVAAHTLGSRPMIVSASDVVELTMPDPSRANASVAVDGMQVSVRRDLECVRVTRGEADVLLVKQDHRTFYDVVAQEFLGGGEC